MGDGLQTTLRLLQRCKVEPECPAGVWPVSVHGCQSFVVVPSCSRGKWQELWIK